LVGTGGCCADLSLSFATSAVKNWKSHDYRAPAD
jgi:hypothetical protein